MPSVEGTVVREIDANSRVIGTWEIDGRTNTFTFNLSNSMPMFKSGAATLTYDTTDDLTGTCTFQGLIGRNQIKVTLDDAVTVSGSLDTAIRVNASVNGTGIWQQS
ncbi:hypothetical protein CERSUDRAFT_95522 [Gelatoporia subvermispora B]|uniref:Uncharacterized protein n=1 Tax=Ceriporiopsis subvermispora (strain B) TaxID=914234 RepID=M2RCN2_CERS8|nr:hypothetical protein CERSUDRAFT_95522 [Gelatoporia subvermispora B]